MTHQELLTRLNNLKDQKVNLINDGDRIYVSEYSTFDFDIIKYKIDEYCNNKNITYNLTQQEFANTIIIDVDDLTRSFLLQYYAPSPGESLPTPPDVKDYPPYREMIRAFNLNQKIINLTDLINTVHVGLTTLDEEMYTSLEEMFNSKDEEVHKLATEVITSSDRNDEKTLEYILKIYQKHYNTLIMSGNPATYELLNAVEKYREKKEIENNKENKEYIHNPKKFNTMDGAQVLAWLMNETREQQKKEHNGVHS